jgi:PAS domain S-box-containing protein
MIHEMKTSHERVTARMQQLLMDHVPSMLAYWDSDLRCRFANKAYERWFGVDPTSLIGTSLRDLLGPELFALNEPHIRAVLRGEPQSFERAIPGPNGGVRHSLANYIPDMKGDAVVGFMVMVADVSRLKEAESALRAQVGALLEAQAEARELRRREEQLRPLFMQAFDGIFIADREGRFTDVNDAGCSLLGYTREEILMKSIADLFPPEDTEHLRQAARQIVDGGMHVGEWTLRRKDGTLVPVEISLKSISDSRWTAFVRDIAAHKRALDAERAMTEELERRVAQRTEQLHELGAELEAAEDRERRQIARDLHDDLGQTLAAARIRLVALCNDGNDSVRKAAHEVDALIASADRSTRSLAEQLAPAVLYELGLCPALEWLAEEIERGFGLVVTVRDDGSPKPLSQVARSILYRAARELLINVAKHAHTSSAALETLRTGDRIVVTVSDAGVGFDTTRAAAIANRGLGLDGIRERLSFIGGSVEVRSVPDEGTVAVLSAPLTTRESMHVETEK